MSTRRHFARYGLFIVSVTIGAVVGAQDTVSEPAATEPLAGDGQATGSDRSELWDQLEEAVAELESEGESVERLEKVGDLYLRLGEVPRAVIAFERAIEAHGGSEELYYKLARALLVGRRPELGLEILKIGVEAYPQSEGLLFELGKAYHAFGKHYAAISTLSRALEIKPGNPTIRYHLADVYRSQRKWEKAEQIIDELIASGSEEVLVHLMKADLLLAQNNERRAVRYLEDLYEKHPNSPDTKRVLHHAYQQYGYTEGKSGRLSRAIKAMESALELVPKDAESKASLATFHFEAGQHEAAEALFKELIEESPEYLEGYALYGTLLRSMDRTEEAKAMFTRGLASARQAKSEEHVKQYSDLLRSF